MTTDRGDGVMERLTKRDSNGKAISAKHCTSSYGATIYEEEQQFERERLERLCELEDKLESGQLVELLCNVEDTIYYVAPKGVFPCPVTRIKFTRGLTPPDELIIEIMYEQSDGVTAPVYKELSAHSYGTLWFTDKAEAEARFKEKRVKDEKYRTA